jgi:hypothetical protein
VNLERLVGRNQYYQHAEHMASMQTKVAEAADKARETASVSNFVSALVPFFRIIKASFPALFVPGCLSIL